MTSELSTTFVVLTPPGRGAIATFEIEGRSAVSVIESFFRPLGSKPLSELQVDRIAVGQWTYDEMSEEVVVCRTGEARFELSCHGGDLAVQRIAANLRSIGADQLVQSKGVDELDENQREAHRQLQLARTNRVAAILLDQYRTPVSKHLKRLQELPAEEQKEALQRIKQLADVGAHLTRPWQVALVGPTNVGKSSLMNALVGYQRAIVFDEPGTTRDIVSAITVLDGWPIELVDTAGLRATSNEIEQQGIERTHQQRASANLVLRVFDASEPAPTVELENEILVANKIDLCTTDQRQVVADGVSRQAVSALTGEGIDPLAKRIVETLVPIIPHAGEFVPLTPGVLQRVGQTERVGRTE